MRKALVNYWVDLATAIAFILCAVTGIVFLFPGIVHTAAGAAPTIILLPATWWHSVHDWTGVALVAGTALHLALHAKWITTMTRRAFGAPTRTAAGRTAAPAKRPAVAVAASGAADQSPTSRVAADDDTAASLQRLADLRSERRLERDRLISRRRFLAGAAAVGGMALLAGAGLIGRDAVSAAATRLSEDGWTGGGQDQSGTATSGQSSSSSSASGSTGTSESNGSATGSSSASAATSTTARVVVDSGSCVGCGACLQVCPAGVFAANGGVVEAQNPDACRLCGRCTQACPAAAITLNG